VEVSAVSERAPARSLAAFAGVFASALFAFLAVGSVLPALPRFVHGPLHAGDVWVGVVTGAFAFTAVVARPVAGRIADKRGRRAVVVGGCVLVAIAGGLYFVPAGVPGLIVARLVLGIGEGSVFTAGATWVIDLAPADRRGRMIGLYGLAVIVNAAALLWAAGVAMRLRTMQAGPIMQMPVFLVLFFAPVYVPLSLLEGWIHGVATINPLTRVLEAGRSFVAGSPAEVAAAYAVALGLIAFFALWALRGLRSAEGAG